MSICEGVESLGKEVICTVKDGMQYKCAEVILNTDAKFALIQYCADELKKIRI